MTTTKNPTGKFLGRCLSCNTVLTATDTIALWAPRTRSCCGRKVTLKAVVGRVTDTECGLKCTSALGPSCDCKCGGERHGADHG